MLLAVLNLIDEGMLGENEIYLNEQLLTAFEQIFRQVSSSRDWCQPGPPFFHLRNSSFWRHKVKPGREQVYAKLTTTGGGTRAIHDNIEYAYFTDEVYEIVIASESRRILRNFLSSMLTQKSNDESKIRLRTVFHESFSLSRDSLRQIMIIISAHTEEFHSMSAADKENLYRDMTQLGTRYVKAMPRFAVGTGLIDTMHNFTDFGWYAYGNDQELQQPGTQWLMHYFLSAPHGPGPAFWHELVVTRFRTGDEFTTEEIAAQIGEFVAANEGKQLAARSARSTATVFLGTYTKEEGLGRLGILQSIGANRYRVQEPDLPPTWAFAYALLDYWHAQFGNLLTVNMDTLYGERGLTSLFLCGAGRLNMILRTMQSEGYVDIYRVAPPYQVVLLRQDREPLLQKLYEHHESE
jgi:hypothetical protein